VGVCVESESAGEFGAGAAVPVGGGGWTFIKTRWRTSSYVGKRRLSESLGEAAYRDSGLGAPDDIRTLQHVLADREQQILELRRQLEERTAELAAARAANRELMTHLNTLPSTLGLDQASWKGHALPTF